MALVKQIPTGSPYEIANNDIGTIVNYNSTAQTFEVENITTTQIRNVLGETTNSISELSTSPNINQWALFKPDGSSPYAMGEFGGYNHDANPPSYYYTQPPNGEYTINSSNQIGIGVIIKKGEMPPYMINANHSWDYIRLTATMSGDVTGTETLLTSAAIDYTPSIILIDVPSNDPYDFTVGIVGNYVNSSNTSVYSQIEDNLNTITVNAVPYYYSAPSTLNDNTASVVEIRHYMVTQDANPQWFVIQSASVAYTPSTSTVTNGLIDYIPQTVQGSYSYGYSVLYIGNKYYKINLNNFTRSVGYKYKASNNQWYKVNSIESGYIFWRVNSELNDIDELAGFPVV